MEPNKGEDAQASLPKGKPLQEVEEAQDHQEALLEEEEPTSATTAAAATATSSASGQHWSTQGMSS